MITRSYPRCAILVTILFLSETSLIGEEPTLDDAWELSRRYQFNEAVKAFSDKDDKTSPSVAAEAHFGLAVNLINRQRRPVPISNGPAGSSRGYSLPNRNRTSASLLDTFLVVSPNSTSRNPISNRRSSTLDIW